MGRHTRYQGFIVKDDQVLLILVKNLLTGQDFWVIPGGGKEVSESEGECIKREIKEETNLDVAVERLLLKERCPPNPTYKWNKTYLCNPISGTASPGCEPEPEVASEVTIKEVRWFDLRDESKWEEKLRQDPYTYPQLVQFRRVLGYIN